MLASRNIFRNSQKDSPVESPRLAAKQKLAVPQADCGEVADAFSCPMMVHNRVSRFPAEPTCGNRIHVAEKVHFVQRPW